jgi:putative transposase
MEPGKYYHLYTHANGTENLFRSDENFRYFLNQYQKCVLPVADTLAYCLMPNHIHFLIRLKYTSIAKDKSPEDFDLGKENRKSSQPFSNLFNSYTKAYNKMYARMGSLFIPNFKRKEVSPDQYLTRIILYIHLNPVRHRFVAHPADWRWSSFSIILNTDETWLKRDEVIHWFGNRNEFVSLHETLDLQGLKDLGSL